MGGWRLRILWLLTGAYWLAWLGLEDRSTTPVLVLAALVVLSCLLTWYRRRSADDGGIGWLRAVTGGVGAGACTPLVAGLLMLVKASLHNHIPADFSSADILLVLARWPAWMLSGLLTGVGYRLLESWWKGARIDSAEAVEYNERG
jgi:hypothetical protein